MARQLMQRRFSGVNVYLPPQDLDPSQVAQADNLFNIGGEFVTRPGKQGLFSALMANVLTVTGATNATPIVITTSVAHGLTTGNSVVIAAVTGNTAANGTWTVTVVSTTMFSLNTSVGNGAYVSGGTVTLGTAPALYEPLPFIKANGTTRIFFALSTGKLYYADKGTWTPTAVTGTTNNISAYSAFMARVGGYGYLVDGVNALLRFDATTGASAVTGQLTPVAAPVATLTNTTKDAMSSATNWAADTIATSFAYTDLVIGTPNTHVSSALRPFQQADVGKTLTITGGPGFTVSTPTVSSVTAGVATLSAGAGTIGSTGGIATLPQVTSGTTIIPNSQTDINAATNGDQTPGATLGTTWFVVGSQTGIAPANDTVGMPSAGYSTIATKWMSLDDSGGAFQTLATTSALGNVVLASPNGDRYAAQFLVSFNYYTSDIRSLQGFKVTVAAYSDVAATAANLVGYAAQNFIPQFANQSAGQSHSMVFDFPGAASNIKSLVVKIGGADSNVNAAQFGSFKGFPFAANILIAPIDNLIPSTGIAPATAGLAFTRTEGDSAYYGKVGGVRITKDYGSNQDWSTSNVLAISLAPGIGSPFSIQQYIDAGLSVRLGFRPTSPSTTHSYSNYVTFSKDATYMFVDVSTVAITVRAAFRYLEIEFMSDLTLSSTTTAFITMGPISFAGNLSIGEASYNWVFEEVNATPSILTVSAATNATPIQVTTSAVHGFLTGTTVSIGGVVGNTAANGVWQVTVVDTLNFTLNSSVGNGGYVSGGSVYSFVNTVESGQSPASNNLDPTGLMAEANVLIPAPLNGTTTHYYVYRYGGVFPQGDSFTTYRLVAIVPVGVDATSGSNTYWTWNSSTRTLLDNTPDSALFGTSTLISGRTPPPVGAQCLCQWQNRMCLAKGSTLSLSWLLNESASAALYFSSFVDPNDPNAAIKGGTFSVGGADNDNIQALVPLGPMLIILKQRSIWMLTGTDGSNFQLSGHLFKAGIGCVAPRAWGLVQNHLWFLSGDGIWEYDGGELIQPKSVEIEPQLCPAAFNQTAIPAVYYKGSAMLYAGKRMYLFAPKDASATSNNIAHVFDARNAGWTRYLGMGITSACTTAAALDTAEIYLAGNDGQLYQLTGSGDKALSGSAATAVAFTFKSRGMGQEEEGLFYWAENIPSVLYASVKTGESAALTFTAIGDGTYSRAYNVNGTATVRLPDVGPYAKGDFVQVGVSGSTITQSKITAIAVDITEGQPSTL